MSGGKAPLAPVIKKDYFPVLLCRDTRDENSQVKVC